MANPIWKDYYVSLGFAEQVQFRIVQDGAVLYQGLSVKRPGESSNTIRINDICADYMRVPPPSFGEGLAPSSLFTFSVLTSTNGILWTIVSTVTFVPDWSYDYSSSQRTVLSDPVNGVLDPRQVLLWSTSQTGMITVTIRYASGGSSQIFVPVTITADFNNDYNADFSKQGVTVRGGTLAVNLSDYDDVAGVQIGSTVYTVAQPCRRYVLYYRNIYGGWDSFLFEGTGKRTDTLTRHEAQRSYDNRDSTGRGTVNYINEVERGYSLNTGWLTDAQSGRMESMLGSNEAYLLDMETGLTWAAVLTGTGIEHKTYDNNGRRLINYAVNLRIAQEMVRR